MTKFLVICDGDEHTGFGHVSRCLSIVNAIRAQTNNISFVFYGSYHDFTTMTVIKCGYQLMRGSVSSLVENQDKLVDLSKEYDLILIDSYNINQSFIDAASSSFKSSLFIDDFNRYHYSKAGLVINFTIGATTYRYLANNTALGLFYFPASQSLRQVRMQRLISPLPSEPKRIVVFIGGSDRMNVGESIVCLVDSVFANTEIKYVAAELKRPLASKRNRVKIILPDQNIANLLSFADLIVSGGGLFKYESAYCCVANGAVTQTADQYLDTELFANAGLTIDMTKAYAFSEKDFLYSLKHLASPQVREAIFKKQQELFDTDSADRLARKCLEVING